MTPEASVPTISGGSVDKKPLDSVDLKMGPGLAGKEAEAAASAKPLPPWSERYPAKAKAVYWTFVQNSSKIYESTPSKTMKYIAVGSAILIFLGALTLVLAQKDESVPNKYGMAFPLDDASSVRSEKRTMFGIPGEGSLPTQAPVVEETTMTEVVTETPTTVKSDVFEAKDVPVQEPTEGGPAVMVAGDEDEKVDDNDQRIVFIERLMGLHLSGPAGQDGEQASSQDNVHDPKKVNAKWATRTRKFSFPVPSQEAQPAQAIPSAEQPHPMLRYAAAAMMSRLIAAAARSQMEAQSREALMMRGGAKDKDDDSEDESVPVLLATVREDEPSIQDIRSRPMYGRPMPRQLGGRPQPPPSVMQRHNMASMAHRIMAGPHEHPQPAAQSRAAAVHPMMEAIQRLQTLQAISRLQEMARQRNGASGEEASEPGTQQALAMVVIPIQSQESRQAVSHSSPFAPHAASPVSPYAAQAAYSPRPAYYPAPHMSPYAPSPYGYHVYHPMVHPAASYAAPVHMPYPSHYPYRPSFGHYPIYPRAPMHPAYTHVRPRVMEMPLDMAMHAPAAMHAPVPMGAVRDHREHQAINLRDHDQSPSDQDHIVLLYDAEVADHDGEGDDLQQSASEHTKMAHGPKGHHFLSQQLPANPSFNKMKLWREMAGAKHAAQPGVRYMPVAIETEESHQQPNQYNAHPRPQVHQQAPQFTHHPQMVDQEHHQPQRGHLESRDTQEHPAFLVMADQDEPTQRRR